MTTELAVPSILPRALADGALSHVRTLLVLLVGWLGAPVALLMRATINRIARTEIVEHLRAIEQLLRRYIVCEAIALAPILAPARRTRAQKRAAPEAMRILDPGDSKHWRAAFGVIPSANRNLGLRRLDYLAARLAGASAPPPPRDEHPARPLAVRLEAALRVATDPAPYIQRLARRLTRKMPRRLTRVFATPFTRWNETNTHLEILAVHAAALLRRQADTS